MDVHVAGKTFAIRKKDILQAFWIELLRKPACSHTSQSLSMNVSGDPRLSICHWLPPPTVYEPSSIFRDALPLNKRCSHNGIIY